MNIRRFLFVTILMIFSTVPAIAGWEFVEDSDGDQRTVYVQTNRIKFVAPDQVLMLDIPENLLFYIDPKAETWWSGPPETFSQAAQKGMAQIEKLFGAESKDSPLRKQFQEARKQADKPATGVKVRSTKKTETIAGFPARKYEILLGGKIRQEKWIAETIKIGKHLDIQRYIEMMGILQKGFGRGGDNSFLLSPEVMALLKKSWPLKTVEYQTDIDRFIETIISAQEKSLADSLFLVPKTYRKIPVTDIFGTSETSP